MTGSAECRAARHAMRRRLPSGADSRLPGRLKDASRRCRSLVNGSQEQGSVSLLVHLCSLLGKQLTASKGCDTSFETTTLKGPRKVRNAALSDLQSQVLSIAASPAPPKIAQQIYTQAILTKMCVRYFKGEAMEKTLAWAEGECEGYMRS